MFDFKKKSRHSWTFQAKNGHFYEKTCDTTPNNFSQFNYFDIQGKSPEVPFHGITSSYSYFEVILIFAPIHQEAKHDQAKLSAEQK